MVDQAHRGLGVATRERAQPQPVALVAKVWVKPGKQVVSLVPYQHWIGMAFSAPAAAKVAGLRAAPRAAWL